MRRGTLHLPVRAGLGLLWACCLGSATYAAETASHVLLLDAAASGPDLVAVGELGSILRSGDNGRSWRKVPSGSTATLTAISFAAESARGWAAGHDALILTTADGGRTWTKQWQGDSLQDSFLSILALDPEHCLAVGAYGLFVSTSDGGKTWSRRKIIEDDFHLNGLSRGPTGTLFLAGEHGTLLRSSDRGEKWVKLAAPYDGSFYGVLPLAPPTLLAFGLRGRVYRSADDGDTWQAIGTPQAGLLATGLLLNRHVILVAGQTHSVLISRDDGLTFAPWTEGLATAVSALLETKEGSILAVGEAGATLLPKPH